MWSAVVLLAGFKSAWGVLPVFCPCSSRRRCIAITDGPFRGLRVSWGSALALLVRSRFPDRDVACSAEVRAEFSIDRLRYLCLIGDEGGTLVMVWIEQVADAERGDVVFASHSCCVTTFVATVIVS